MASGGQFTPIDLWDAAERTIKIDGEQAFSIGRVLFGHRITINVRIKRYTADSSYTDAHDPRRQHNSIENAIRGLNRIRADVVERARTEGFI